MGKRRKELHPREILRAEGLFARRGLGQIFLVSGADLERVVEAARLCGEEVVLEIGTGLGRLTRRLAERAAAVVSVEIDGRLLELARRQLAGLGNVALLHGDALAGKHRISPAVEGAVARAARGRPVKVVSNLPYGISSPAIVNLLEWRLPVAELDVMLQAEVAERLTARPGTAQYGPLSVFAGYHADVERVFALPPSAFWPPPAVRSWFVRIVPRPPAAPARSYAMFRQVVNRLLRHRRKTLGHALRLGWGPEMGQAVLAELGLDGGIRPDRLSPAEFVRIADVLAARGTDAGCGEGSDAGA